VHVRVENTDTPFTCAARPGQILKMPIAHMEGNYFCDAATLAELERNKQIVFRYVHADGRAAGTDDFDANPNGALAAIAGLCNRERNVVGLMPHPERAVEAGLGSTDGLVIFQSMVASLSRRAAERVSA
jgi:phosphoribosylformylglycinamidine synthase subunit PurQ / glutaminase